MGVTNMRKDLCFALVGGDLRQSCLANLLAGEGYEVYALGFDDCVELTDEVCCTADLAGTLAKCDVAIFPLPLTVDGTAVNAPFAKEPPALKACLRALNKKALLLGGMASEDVCALAREYGFTVLDYYQREEMIVRNCVPTAEGALCIAMQETAKTIFGSKCLVTGFGRVSRAMTALLLACGAKVSVAARKQGDLAWIKLMGAEPVPMAKLKEAAASQEIIFNTVPVKLFNEEVLCALHKDCLLIDLASKPGGVDLDAARHLGIRVIWALSLPGKVAPISAAQIIKDTVFNILEERGA